MPLDPDIPFRAIAGLTKAQPYDPVAVQADIDRQRVHQAAAQKAQQEMAEQADLQQLAQQYGNDYDGLIDAAAKHGHTEWALDISKKLQDGRVSGGQARWEQTRASRAEIQSDLSEMQGQDATTWPDFSQKMAKKYPSLAPAFLRPFSPQLVQQLAEVGRSQDSWLQSIETGAKSVADGKTLKGFAEAYAGADTPEKRAMVDQMAESAKAAGMKTYFPDAASAQAYLDKQAKEKPEKSATVGSFEDYMTADPAHRAQILKDRKAYNQADDKARAVVGGGGAAGGTTLTPGPGGGLESLATQFRLMKRFPVGMARTIDKDDAKRVVNLAAEQDRLIGRSPAASIQKAAMFQANAKAAGQMAVLGAGTEAAESKALGQIDIIKELSPKVWRTSSTGINEWLVNPTQRFTGNKDAQSLANAILTFSSEYAKIINGSVGSVAGASDSSRNDAAKLISNALDHGNLMQQLTLMQREMALTRVGYDVAQQHIAEQMQGPQVPGATPTAGAAPDPASLRQKYKY